MIYLIEDERGRVKIGVAKSHQQLKNRLSSLQTGNADRLTLIDAWETGIYINDYDIERQLHETFAHLHIRGEWFTKHPDIIRAFEECLIP